MVFVHFPRRLAAVAAVTQALEIAAVTEHCPVALVVDDVVDVGSADAPASSGTLSAEWLAHELRRSKILAPFVGEVHPAPGLRLGATLFQAFLWLMP